MNMMAVSCGETTIVIDAGVMFPGPDLLGVDLIVPDLTYLQDRRVAALVLTHGHEDHIGGVPYVWPLLEGPVYGTPLTLALVEPKLEEHQIDPGDRLVTVAPGDRIVIGSITVEFLRVTHSIPDCVGLALHTPAGTLVHTGDFKVDQTPLDGQHVDLHRFATLGSEGVLALLADSTNIDRRGFTGSEIDVIGAFEEIFTSATGMLVVATFSSSLFRVQILVRLAARFGRKVAFVGRGMMQNSVIAQRLGHLTVPEGVQIRDSEVPNYPPSQVLCISTGTQGEPRSALSRIAVDDHKHVKIGPGDTVVLSARAIPGNEKAIGRVINHLTRRGAEIITEANKHVHVSGHGSEEEIKLIHSLVRPQYFVPVHGEFRHLAEHKRIAERVTAGASAAGRGPADRKRRHPALRCRGRRSGRQGADRSRADRRHARGRGRRRGPARSPAPGRRRHRPAGGGGAEAGRRAGAPARDHHARRGHRCQQRRPRPSTRCAC